MIAAHITQQQLPRAGRTQPPDRRGNAGGKRAHGTRSQSGLASWHAFDGFDFPLAATCSPCQSRCCVRQPSACDRACRHTAGSAVSASAGTHSPGHHKLQPPCALICAAMLMAQCCCGAPASW